MSKRKPLRVTMISDYPRNGVVQGGVESAAEILAESLAASSAIEAIEVLDFRPELQADEVVRVNDKLTVRHVVGQQRFTLPTHSAINLRRARQFCRDFRPDVVHGQTTAIPGHLAVRLGYPSVVTIHGVGLYEVQLRERDKGLLGRARVWMTKRMLRRIEAEADVIVALSDFGIEYLKHVRSGNVVKIPNGVRTVFFNQQQNHATDPHLVYVGLLIPRKNIVGMLRAFRNVQHVFPEAKLDLIGEPLHDDYRSEIEATIADGLSAHVTMHGSVFGQKLIDLMNNARALVLFSDYENLPCVIAESLALGRPVVGTAVGAVHEMVADGEDGFLIPPRNADAFAERVLRLLRDRQLSNAMGARGAEKARARWCPEIVAAETVQAYYHAVSIAKRKH